MGRQKRWECKVCTKTYGAEEQVQTCVLRAAEKLKPGFGVKVLQWGIRNYYMDLMSDSLYD